MSHGGKRTTAITKKVICAYCGKSFNFQGIGRPSRYCSDECQASFIKEKRGYQLICQQCGKEFCSLKSNARYCSNGCYGAAQVKETHYRTKHKKICPICNCEFETINSKQITCSPECGKKQTGLSLRRYRVCIYCGKDYYGENAFRQDYCSAECSRNARFGTKEEHAARDEQHREAIRAAHLVTKACRWCGREFETVYPSHCYCSKECGYEGNLRDKRSKWADEYNPHTFECKECGITVVTECGKPLSSFCSIVCQEKFTRRKYQQKRKEQMQTSYKAPVSFNKIYKRDNGICGICGLPVPNNKSPENVWGATIDHIVPLSQGGTHEPSNCQLAHRLCNSMKLDTVDDFVIDWEAINKRDSGRWENYLNKFKNQQISINI